MVALFLGVFALVMVVGRKQAQRARQNLAGLAQQYGLALPPEKKGFFAGLSSPSLGGSVRGRQLRIYNYTTGSGKNRTTWCALAVSVRNPGRLTLKVSRENLLTRAGRMFGVDDVATGDPAFDQEFYVKSNDAGYVRAAFLPEVRSQISTAWQQGARGTIKLDGGEITYAEAGTFTSAKICQRWPTMIDLAFLLADVVEARGM